MATATTPTLELNNGVTMPALGLGGVRGGPDPELLNRETAPLVVDNS
jgi:hypothetical protein